MSVRVKSFVSANRIFLVAITIDLFSLLIIVVLLSELLVVFCLISQLFLLHLFFNNFIVESLICLLQVLGSLTAVLFARVVVAARMGPVWLRRLIKMGSLGLVLLDWVN